MSPKEKVKIFLDGSNFYYYCKDIGIPAYPNFDFDKLINILANGRLIKEKSYLKKNEWRINKGYLLKTKGKHHEKGVEYIGFSSNPSNAMLNKCDRSILLGKKILKSCVI